MIARVAVLIFASLIGVAHAGVETRPELPTPARPKNLGAARDLWMTLIEGKPQFSNWTDAVVDHYGPDGDDEITVPALRLITDAIHASVDQPVVRQAYLDTVYPLFLDQMKNLGFDRMVPGPVDLLQESWARTKLSSGGPTAAERRLRENEAYHRVIDRWRLRPGDRLNPEQKAELNRATWEIDNDRSTRNARSARDVFESWRARELLDANIRHQSQRRQVMLKMLSDPWTYAQLTYDRLGRNDPTPADRLLSHDVAHVDPSRVVLPEDLGEKLEDKFDNIRLKNRTFSHAMFFVNDAQLGWLAVHFGHEDLTDTGVESVRNGSPYDGYGISRKMAYIVTLDLIDQQAKAAVKMIKGLSWSGSSDSVPTEIVRLGRKFERTVYPNMDWSRPTYLARYMYQVGQGVTEIEYKSYGMRNLIYHWQIATRGFDYWREREDQARHSHLATLPPVQKKEYGGSYPRASSDGLESSTFAPSFTDVSDGAGNFEGADRWETRFTASRSNNQQWPARYRLANRTALNSATRFYAGDDAGTIEIATAAPLRASGPFLMLPTPQGYEPVKTGARIRLTHGDRSVTRVGSGVSFVYSAEAGAYGIKINPDWAKSTEGWRIEEMTVHFKRQTTKPPKYRLNFTADHLRFGLKALRKMGAVKVVDAVEAAMKTSGQVSARELTTIFAERSCYSFEPRELRLKANGAHYGDFVEDGTLHIQCSVAAHLLEWFLQNALREHPLRERVQLRKISVIAAKPNAAGSQDLGEFHAQLEVVLDGEPVDVLDSTPGPADPAGASAAAAARPRVAPAARVTVDHAAKIEPPPLGSVRHENLKAALGTMVDTRADVVQALAPAARVSGLAQSPPWQTQLLLKLVGQLTQAALNPAAGDQGEQWRKQIAEYLHLDARATTARVVLESLRTKLNEAMAQTERVAANLSADANLARAAATNGQGALYAPGVVHNLRLGTDQAYRVLEDPRLVETLRAHGACETLLD